MAALDDLESLAGLKLAGGANASWFVKTLEAHLALFFPTLGALQSVVVSAPRTGPALR